MEMERFVEYQSTTSFGTGCIGHKHGGDCIIASWNLEVFETFAIISFRYPCQSSFIY